MNLKSSSWATFEDCQTSAGMLSMPVALPCFICLTASLNSSLESLLSFPLSSGRASNSSRARSRSVCENFWSKKACQTRASSCGELILLPGWPSAGLGAVVAAFRGLSLVVDFFVSVTVGSGFSLVVEPLPSQLAACRPRAFCGRFSCVFIGCLVFCFGYVRFCFLIGRLAFAGRFACCVFIG